MKGWAMKRLAILGLLVTAAAWGQVSNPTIIPVTAAPTGSCTGGLPNQQVISTGIQYSCQSGTWAAAAGSVSGTVGSGTANSLTCYPSTGTAVGACTGITTDGSGNLTATGTVAAGSSTTSTPTSFLAHAPISDQFAHGYADETALNATVAAGGYGSFSAAIGATYTQNTDHYWGYQYFPTLGGSVTLSSASAVISTPTINSGLTVTSLYGAYMDEWKGTGVVGTYTGLFIAPFAKAATNWGIYDEAPKNYMSGNLAIGQSSSILSALDVAGDTLDIGGNNPLQLTLRGVTNPNYQLRLGEDTTTGLGVIQSETAGTAYTTLQLNPNGGSVAVGPGGLTPATTRKGTFVCTAGGTITILNTNEIATSDVIISLNAAGGTISAPPAMKTVTAGTGFTVLCSASDTSTYNYDILN